MLSSVVPLMFEMLGPFDLLALRGTSREFCSLVSHDHAWTEAWKRTERFPPLGLDERTMAFFPSRECGHRRDSNSSFPFEPERVELADLVLPDGATEPQIRLTEGVLEDLFHPGSEDADTRHGIMRTVVYKARPLPLCCKVCNVECHSYASFTEHCLLPSHKVLLDPSTRFDPRFKDIHFHDPRHAGDVFKALPTMAKFKAMCTWCTFMVAFFRKTMGAAGRRNMMKRARVARECVLLLAQMFRLSKENVEPLMRSCTAKCVTRACVEDFVIEDFFERGLEPGSYALAVLQYGWGKFDMLSSDSKHLMASITGLDW